VGKLVTFAFSASSTIQWTADADYNFVGGFCQPAISACAVVDNFWTPTLLNTPTSTGSAADILWFRSGTSAQASTESIIGFPMKIPVPAGTVVFVKSSAAGTVMLYFELSAET
jgi:hypothetical protein